jgi:hypothetical protein
MRRRVGRERGEHVRIELGALHVRAIAALCIGEPGRRALQLGCLLLLSGPSKCKVDECIMHSRYVGIPDQLLVGEVDRDVLFMDQDAADVQHCAQVEQIDQQQLAADAKTREKPEEQVVFHGYCHLTVKLSLRAP